MKTRKGLWNSLESFTTPLAVLAEWKLGMGPEFDKARVFLRPVQSQAESYPCTNHPSCGVRHEVRELEGSVELRAVLRDELGQCPAISLLPRDVINHELDAQKIGEAICAALGFEIASAGAPAGALRPRRIGSWGAARSPVFLLVVGSEAGFLKELAGLCSAMPDPFILLTATQAHCTPALDGALRQHRCAFIPLAAHLALEEGGRFKVTKPIDGILSEFQARLSEGKGLVKTVERLDRNMDLVARDKYELRKENEELKGLLAGGHLKFVLAVEAQDFLAFACIMALGNQNAAAKRLKIPHRSFYDRVKLWKNKGREYQRMFRLVEWRKAVGRKLKLRLEDSVQSGEPDDKPENPKTIEAVLDGISQADSRDYPAILREILEALSAQNPGNWASVRDELVGIVKAELG